MGLFEVIAEAKKNILPGVTTNKITEVTEVTEVTNPENPCQLRGKLLPPEVTQRLHRGYKIVEAGIFPFSWLQKYDHGQLERLAIMTVDGGLSDEEAERIFNTS